jgi:hypothetical protein
VARPPAVAFFVTVGGVGFERALATIEAVAGRKPTATLVLRTEDFKRAAVADLAVALSPSKAAGPLEAHMPSPSKIVVIAGGIAGLCTAVYARKCGYEVDLFEMHDTAGELATSCHRGGYVFETCLHWPMGFNPNRPFHERWREVLDRLKFVGLERIWLPPPSLRTDRRSSRRPAAPGSPR